MGPKSKTKSEPKETEIIIPEPTLITPTLEGTAQSELPFQEWSDVSLNAERWDFQKGTADEAAPDHFKDPQMVYLPYSIVVQKWKRPSEIYPDVNFIIYEERPAYPDLISGSKHLLHSEFVRSFISSIHTLLYLGNTGQFNIEFISPSYAPSTEDLPWRPWHHIYSNCYAGKGKDHDPTVNKLGKYIVRLFWMGTWRKIYVDDLLPVDLLDHVLLPSLELTKEELEKLALLTPKEEEPPLPPEDITNKPEKAEKKSIEIWPFLLSKALLKIASLSWYDEREILDFDIIQCLTGWIPQTFSTQGLEINDIWDILSAYTDHFCWPAEKTEVDTADSKPKEKGKKGALKLADLDTEYNAHHLLACCNDLRGFSEDEIVDVSPCWSHYFLIDQTRDIPLFRPTITADLAFWKKFRWLAWKIEKGMVPAEELKDRIRCLKIVSPFKKVYEHVEYEQPSKIVLNIETTVNKVTEEVQKEKGKGKGKEKGKEKGKDKEKGSKKKGGTDKSSKGTKSSKGKKAKPKIDVSQIPNPSIWVDFEKLSTQINTISIYLKPSKFKTRFVISDLNFKKPVARDIKPPTAKKNAPRTETTWKNIVHPKTTVSSRNEPIYIFADSIDYKLIVVNLVQEGYTPILKIEEEPPPEVVDITECEFCTASLVKRIKRNITKAEEHNYISVAKAEAKPIIHYRPKSHLVLEKFNWQTDQIGEMISSINTYGTKAVTLDLTPGRQILRLWLSSDMSYLVHVLSDTPIVIGCLEGLLFQMSQESQLLINMCIEIASSYGKLVQAFGTPEFPIQLKAFYNSYKPDNYLTKAESAIVHDTFYNLLSCAVEDALSSKELRALSILFFKWQFPSRVHYVDEVDLCKCLDEDEDVYFLKTLQWYTVRIQAFFRGVYERALMKRHRPEHKEHLEIFEKLKAIYDAIFSAQRRLVTCPNLLRVFMYNPHMQEIKRKYSVADDIENVITLQEVESTVDLPEDGWCIICRQQFFVNSPESVVIKISLFCDLSNYFVRVFNNDTKEEIKRYSNNVSVTKYDSNVCGYIILCYGFSSEAKSLPYKLSFATKKDMTGPKLIIPQGTTRIDTIRGIYIPNVNNRICRYLVHVSSNSILLTIRFCTGYDKAIVNLKLMNDYGKVIQEVTGTKNVILPNLILHNTTKAPKVKSSEFSLKEMKSSSSMSSTKSKKSEKATAKPPSHAVSILSKMNVSNRGETIYVVEATVMHNTWPLTADEWRNVNRAKVPTKGVPGVRTTYSVRSFGRHLSITGLDFPLCDPQWTLQMICNTADVVRFTQDTRREDEIQRTKRKWYEEDEMRYHTSKDLRQEFLEEHLVENVNLIDAFSLRSLSPNIFTPEILPPLDLSEFMLKNPEEVEGDGIDTRILKTEADFQADIDEENEIMKKFENIHQRLIADMNDYVSKQISTFELYNNWYNECRADSMQRMNDAANLKDEYVRKVVEQRNKERETKKGKKNKSGKKK